MRLKMQACVLSFVIVLGIASIAWALAFITPASGTQYLSSITHVATTGSSTNANASMTVEITRNSDDAVMSSQFITSNAFRQWGVNMSAPGGGWTVGTAKIKVTEAGVGTIERGIEFIE